MFIHISLLHKNPSRHCLVCHCVSKAQNSPGTQQALNNDLFTDVTFSSGPWAGFFIFLILPFFICKMAITIRTSDLVVVRIGENSRVSLPAHRPHANGRGCLILTVADTSGMRADMTESASLGLLNFEPSVWQSVPQLLHFLPDPGSALTSGESPQAWSS